MSASILQEIASVKNFLKSRAVDVNHGALLKNFADAVIQQLNACLSIDKDNAALMMAALADNPYGETHTKRVVSTIDAKVLKDSIASKNAVGVRDQVLKEWWNYLTQEDWDVLRSARLSFHTKMARIVERANLVGCSNPHQQTVKWMLATICLSHYDELPSPKILFDKFLDLKQVIIAERKVYPHEQLSVFPSSPSELPAAVHSYAYADAAPIQVQLPGVNSIAAKISMRGTNNMLKKHTSSNKSEPDTSKPLLVKPEATTHVAQAVSEADKADMPTPGDAVEMQLFSKYKADLWKHRAQKHGLLLQPGSSGQHGVSPEQHGQNHCAVPTAGVPLKLEPDGSLVLTPRSSRLFVKQPGAAAVMKQEQPGKPGAAVPAKLEHSLEHASASPCKEEDSDYEAEPTKPKGEVEDKSDEEMDEFAAAAIAALAKRDAKKKMDIAAKRKAKAAAKKSAAKAEGTDAAKTEPAGTEPAKKVRKLREVEEVPKAQIYKAMPKTASEGNPPPVFYAGGVVYTVQKSQLFRCLTTRGDKYPEVRSAWGKTQNKKEAWKGCIAALEKKSK